MRKKNKSFSRRLKKQARTRGPKIRECEDDHHNDHDEDESPRQRDIPNINIKEAKKTAKV